jgi:uncharacterized membrane protein
MIYFIVLIVIALGLTFMSLKARWLLFRLAAAMAWLACGVYLLVGGNSTLSISDVWNQILGFIFIVMAVAVLLLQIVTEVRRESDGVSYTSFERLKKPKGPSRSQLVQDDYRRQVRTAVNRGRSRRG